MPVSFSLGQPCSSPEAIKLAKTGITAPFIVIDTLIWSSGIPSNNIFISSIESIATPAFPTSANTLG